jgi:LuxR family maltose regulon positive regulatory protein
LLLHTLGQTPQAHQYLERALELAEPEGFMRVFIDEGEMMRVLLIDLRKTMDKRLRTQTNHASQRLRVYLLKILAGFLVTQDPVPVAAEALAEPLSQRELEVLHLIGAGLSNQQIADELVVAVSTVKSHINHLYGKLGAHSRVQAVSVARDLHLLAD